MVAQRLRMRVVFVDGVMEQRDQFLDQGHFLLGDSQPALGFAQRLFLVGVRDGVAALLRELAAVEVGSCLHQVLLPPLDLRLPVAELVALEPVAHAAQLHIDPAQGVPRLLGEVDHRQLEVLERLDGQDIG